MSPKELQARVEDLPSYILDDDFIIYHRYIPLIKDEIIDLGTGWGKSAIAMAILNPESTIYSFDDGSYPIYQKWNGIKNEKDYEKELEKQFEKHNVDNITLVVSNLINVPVAFDARWKLIHFDLTKEQELEALRVWLPRVEINGLALIRNFDRVKDNLGGLLDDFEYIDQGGLIHVYRRVR